MPAKDYVISGRVISRFGVIPGERGILAVNEKAGDSREVHACLSKINELVALLEAQGEALRRGDWSATRSLQARVQGLAEEILHWPASVLAGATTGGALKRDLREALARVENQLTALVVLREEVARELREVYYWRQRLGAFSRVRRPGDHNRLDVKG